MKLQDINPLVWAPQQFYTNDGTGGVNPWRNGTSPTKLAPPPSVYTEGHVPKSPAAAEYENYWKNQTSQLESTLAFDRLGSKSGFYTPNTAPYIWKCTPGYDSKRRVNFAPFVNIAGTAMILRQLTPEMKSCATVMSAMLTTYPAQAGTGCEVAYLASADRYLVGFTSGRLEIVDPTGGIGGSSTSITPSFTGFSRVCRPIDVGPVVLFAGTTTAGYACIVRATGASGTSVVVNMPTNVTSTVSNPCKFEVLPSGRIWFLIYGDITSFYSDNLGVSWTASTGSFASVPYCSVYDPDNGVWIASVGVVTAGVATTVIRTTSGNIPNTGLTTVRTMAEGAIFESRSFGRYTIGLMQRSQLQYLGGYDVTAHVVGSADYGRTWHILDTVQTASTSTLSESAEVGAMVNFSTGTAFTALQLRGNDNGWNLMVDQGAFTHLQFMNPVVQRDTAL